MLLANCSVPPVMPTLPSGSAPLAATTRVPELTAVPPVKVLWPRRVSVPEPFMVRPAPLMPVPPRFLSVAESVELGASRTVAIGLAALPTALPSMFSTPLPASVRMEFTTLLEPVSTTLMFAYMFTVPLLMMRLGVAVAETLLVKSPSSKVPGEPELPTVKTPVAVAFGVLPPMMSEPVGPRVLVPPVSAARITDCTANVPVSKVTVALGPLALLPVLSPTVSVPAWTVALWPANRSWEISPLP